jgi:NitT/TauT family transport system substrate-binding protein
MRGRPNQGFKTLLGLIAALVGTIFSPPQLRADEVIIGDQGIIADLPYYIAAEFGYFAEENIQPRFERMASSTSAIAPLSTNRIQVVGASVSAALFNAFARDWPVRIVMGRTRDEPRYSGDALMIRDDLKESVKQIADLKGKKIAINAPASSLEYMLSRMLRKAGLDLADVQISYMPWPDMGAAMRTKAIDGGLVVEPFVVRYVESGLAVVFRRASEELSDPPLESSVMLYNMDWMKQRPDQVKRFTNAYLKGLRDYYDAMTGGPIRGRVIQTAIKYTMLKDAALYDRIQWSYMDPDPEIPKLGLKDQQDWYRTTGYKVSDFDLNSMFDETVLKDAFATAGRFAGRPN